MKPIFDEKRNRWRLQYTDKGKKKRIWRHTKAEINQFIKDYEKEQSKLGEDGLRILTDKRRRGNLITAYDKISKYDLDLNTVVDFYLQHHKRGMLVKDVVSDYMRFKKQNVRLDTYRNINNGMIQFQKVFKDRIINSITSNDIINWLDEMKVSIESKKHYRRLVNGLFNYCFKRSIIDSNVISLVPVPKDPNKDTTIHIYDSETIQKWIKETTDKKIKLFIAISAYTGARPKEVSRLRYEHFIYNEDDKVWQIDMPSHITKTGDRRVVTVLPILEPFIKKLKGKGNIFPYDDFGNSSKFKRWRKNKDWIQDGFRKTYVSHHIAWKGSAEVVCEQIGHVGDFRLIKKHYHQVGLSQKKGKEYFGIISNQEDLS